MKKKFLFVLAPPIALCAVAWGIEEKREEMPALILSRYPQDTGFRMVTNTHLKSHIPERMGFPSPGHPLLLTSYFHNGRKNVILWSYANTNGQGLKYREAVNWAIQATHPFRWSSQQMTTVRTLLRQMPPSAPPKLRGDVLIVSFESGGTWQTRIYNHNSLPNTVRQVLLLTGQ